MTQITPIKADFHRSIECLGRTSRACSGWEPRLEMTRNKPAIVEIHREYFFNLYLIQSYLSNDLCIWFMTLSHPIGKLN